MSMLLLQYELPSESIIVLTILSKACSLCSGCLNARNSVLVSLLSMGSLSASVHLNLYFINCSLSERIKHNYNWTGINKSIKEFSYLICRISHQYAFWNFMHVNYNSFHWQKHHNIFYFGLACNILQMHLPLPKAIYNTFHLIQVFNLPVLNYCEFLLYTSLLQCNSSTTPTCK